mmetsp:Transcript_7286/g.12306  ORF Transcript_7286/g.12306 Transcript_7286/m.12306 type:complete len:215 (-) Transcript_7286:247-891(-)
MELSIWSRSSLSRSRSSLSSLASSALELIWKLRLERRSQSRVISSISDCLRLMNSLDSEKSISSRIVSPRMLWIARLISPTSFMSRSISRAISLFFWKCACESRLSRCVVRAMICFSPCTSCTRMRSMSSRNWESLWWKLWELEVSLPSSLPLTWEYLFVGRFFWIMRMLSSFSIAISFLFFSRMASFSSRSFAISEWMCFTASSGMGRPSPAS